MLKPLCSKLMTAVCAQGNSTANSDFTSAVQQIVALGFNTVKLPFSFSNLLMQPADPVSQGCTATSKQGLQVGLQQIHS